MVAISLDAFISGQGTVGYIGLASMYIHRTLARIAYEMLTLPSSNRISKHGRSSSYQFTHPHWAE